MSSPDITLYGADWCGDCLRAKKFLDTHGVAYEFVDLVARPDQADTALAISGRTNIPVITFADGTHQVEPSNSELETKLRQLGTLA